MPHSASIYDRRQFLLGTSALSLTTALLPTALSAQVASPAAMAAPVIPTPDTLLKFNSDGSRRAFAGNTVICHVPTQTLVHDAIAAFGDDLRRSSFAGKLGLLPPDSYHMTIFPGANDQKRSSYGWPSDIPINTSIAECDRIVGERMKQFHLRCELPLRVKVDLVTTMSYGLACTLRMAPLNQEENAKLRWLRDRLSEVYRFRTQEHDVYAFHITLSYQLSPFTALERSSYQELLARHLQKIITANPVIELGLPEFCTFDDMYRFEIRTLLAT